MQILCSGIAHTQLEIVVKSREEAADPGLHNSQLHLLQSAGGWFLHICFTPASHPAHSPGTDEGELGWKRECPHGQGQTGFLLYL